jgi:hypothetical protein
MKTLAELKRNANEGRMSLELIEWYGKFGNDIPERLHGIRKVKKSNTVALFLVNKDGKESEMRIDCGASLIEYNGKTLVVYASGEREATEEEQNVLNGYKRLQEEYYKENPYGDFYWKSKDYFKNCSCPWMSGFDEIKGKKYQSWNGKIRDNAVKGTVILRYNVYMEN